MSQKVRFVHLNGKIVPANAARISVLDRGFLYGDGVFESIRSYRGRLPFLKEHIARIRASLDLLGIAAAPVLPALGRRIRALLRANGLLKEDAFVRIQISSGEGVELGLAAKGKTPTVVILAYALGDSARTKQEQGITALPVEGLHTAGAAKIKFSNYARSILALREAKAAGCDDAILLDEKGYVAEASTASLFYVKGKTLVTPPLSMGLLPGITREIVLEIAPKAGLKVVEKKFRMAELLAADEVFFTASISEIYPVRAIGKRPVRNFARRPYVRRLIELYAETVSRYRE